MDCSDFVIDVLNTKIYRFYKQTSYDEIKIHKSLIDIFYKIISR